MGQAATGTGKTAAFALPLLHRLDGLGPARPRPSALILVPTRELAVQVAEAVHRYGRLLEGSVLPLYGGQSFGQQARALARGMDVVVATPGRALDHLRRATLDLSGLSIVVLDEADEMLDMGFAEDIQTILAATPAARQTMLFSVEPAAADQGDRQTPPQRPGGDQGRPRTRDARRAAPRAPDRLHRRPLRTSRPRWAACSTSRTPRPLWSSAAPASRSTSWRRRSPPAVTVPRRCTAAWRKTSASVSWAACGPAPPTW